MTDDERHDIRPSIARAVKNYIPDDEQTVAIVGADAETGPTRPTVHLIPCEHAAVVWFEFLGETTHEAVDCSASDGVACAAELITDYIDDVTDEHPGQTVPVEIEGPDADAIVDGIDIRGTFYDVRR